MTAERVGQAYSSLARQYIDLFGSVDSVHPDDLRLIGDHLGGLTGPVLDLGCGPGQLSGFLSATGSDVTGIDLVPEFVAHARAAHPASRFELGSFAPLTWPDASVAGVLAWFSLIHLDPAEMGGALAEIRRVLQPGGAVVVGFFEGAVCEPFEHRVIEAHRWPAAGLARLLAEAGFDEVERVRRPRDGDRRPYAALAARAVDVPPPAPLE